MLEANKIKGACQRKIRSLRKQALKSRNFASKRTIMAQISKLQARIL
jgi:hypothetical protein